MDTVLFWLGFHLLVAGCVAIDIWIFRRKRHALTFKRACVLSGFWIVVALLFNLWIYLYLGPSVGLQFFTGYLIEKSLSIDNLLLFLLIFTHFKVSAADQNRILLWGIMGVIVLRITLILMGITLLNAFHWVFYLFGLFLVISGVKLFLTEKKGQKQTPDRLFYWLSKWMPVASSQQRSSFFVIEQGKWKVTRLFILLGVIELTDIVLALDSIPAVFAVTTHPFIVYTSNIFAILGLRALYFVLAPALSRLQDLKPGLALILIFMGCKILVSDVFPITVLQSLGVIVLILGITVVRSLYRTSHPG